MALSFSTDLKNYIVNKALVEALAGTCGTAGTASISIYSGSQPANADAGTSGTLLCVISGVGWTATTGTTSGTAALASTAAYEGTASTSGTAGWARFETVSTDYAGQAATFRVDGNVGTASTCTFVINAVSITGGGIVSLVTAPISMA
jgi:hypothetical protein